MKPPDSWGYNEDDEGDDSKSDEDEYTGTSISIISRCLGFEESGPKHRCGNCNLWIKEDHPRYKMQRLYPEIQEAADSHGPGPAPFWSCESCYFDMEVTGNILIEPKE